MSDGRRATHVVLPRAGGGPRSDDHRTIWFPAADPDSWVECQLLYARSDGSVTLSFEGKETSFAAGSADLISPRLGADHDAAGDLAELERSGLGLARVEECLRDRVCAGMPYARSGNVTVFVNPCRDLQLYDDAWIAKYAELSSSLPPHIYDAAARAYTRLMDSSVEARQAQSIYLLGEARSGKSHARGHLLEFWTHNASSNDELDGHLKYLQVLMKYFVSVRASTQDDPTTAWSSTRALTSVELGFDCEGFLCTASASVELLEANRLGVFSGWSGSCFHAFLLALKEDSAQLWIRGRATFAALGEEITLSGSFATIQEVDPEGEELQAWQAALEAFGLDFADVIRVLCGILLLAEVGAEGEAAGTAADAAAALGVDAAALSGLLKPMGGCGSFLAVHLYRGLVAAIIQEANVVMSGDTEAARGSITVIEVPAWLDADGPPGSDGLALQWLEEASRLELLAAATRRAPANAGDAADVAASVESVEESRGVVDAIEGFLGLVAVMKALPSDKFSAGTSKWAKAWGLPVRLGDEASDVECEFIGTTGSRTHRLGACLLHAAFGELIAAQLHDVAALLGSSESSLCTIVGVAVAAVAVGDAGSSEDFQASAVNGFRRAFRGASNTHTSLVVCLRANDIGTASPVRRSTLLRQAGRFLLSDIIHLQSNAMYVHVWPLRVFRHLYGRRNSLPPTFSLLDDVQACQLILIEWGAGEGVAGQEHVYGTRELKEALDARIAHGDTTAGTDALFAAERGHMDDAAARDAFSGESSEGELSPEDAAEAQDPPHGRGATVWELQRELDDFEEAIEAERLQQEVAWDLVSEVRARRDGASLAARVAEARYVAPQGAPKLVLPTVAGPEGVLLRQDHRREMMRDLVRSAGADELVDRYGQLQLSHSDIFPSRSMSQGNHATVHTALMQVASMLRCAREEADRLRSDDALGAAEADKLAETGRAWREEAKRLRRGLEDL